METIKVEMKPETLDRFERYLYERENASATIRKYITDIRTFFCFLGDDLMVDKQRILAYKDWLMKHYAVSSINSMLAALNRYLEFLELDALKVKRIKVQKSLFLREEKELTQKEYQKLLNTALSEGKYQLALCMETIASTGIRISELEFFTVEALKQSYIVLVNKGKYRRIFLPRKLRMKLLRYAGRQKIKRGPIFVTRNGKPKSRSNIWREMKALKKQAGIDGDKIFPHNLRHLFARIYYKMTQDLAGLGDLLGHSSLNVTRIYTSNTGKIYQKQLDSIDDLRMQINTT